MCSHFIFPTIANIFRNLLKQHLCSHAGGRGVTWRAHTQNHYSDPGMSHPWGGCRAWVSHMVAEVPGGASPRSWISFSTSWLRLGPHHQGKWGGWKQLLLSSRNHSSIIRHLRAEKWKWFHPWHLQCKGKLKSGLLKLALNLVSLSDKIL